MGTRPSRFRAFAASLSAILFAVGLSSPAVAAGASAESTVVTLTPLTVTKTSDLNFGAIIPGTGNSRITVDTRTGDRARASGTATLVGTGHSRAAFLIYGGPNQLVTVSIPGAVTITRENATETMRVRNMQIGNGGNAFGTFVRGNMGTLGVYQLTVGGELTVGGNQARGRYAGQFVMTVNYP